MKISPFAALLLSALLLPCCSRTPAYLNPSLSAQERTEDLLKRMTREEKIGQLICPLGWPMYTKTSDSTATYSPAFEDFISKSHGGMLWATFRADPWTGKTLETGLNPRAAASAYNALQRYAIRHSRLGIPIILAEEAPHGHMAIGATVYPTGLAMAASWDTSLVHRVYSDIREEVRSSGAAISYGPVLDLAREPRWSRVEETFGEDTFLTSEMGRAALRGLSPKYNGWDKGTVATLKHFVAYGVPQGGHNGSPSFVGVRQLREEYLPPFKAALEEGALSVMTSYNSIDGIPSTANGRLVNGILKDEWGFEGIVVSDLVSIDGLAGDHHIAGSLGEAAQLALEAGVDVDLGANCYPLLEDGPALDNAVRRVLMLKFQLGLFDNPYVDETKAELLTGSEQHANDALLSAREGTVLLENNGILPLRKDMKVAVIGPNADAPYNQLGDYTAPQPVGKVITPLQGIREKIGSDRVSYVKGCAIRDNGVENIAAAVRAARDADVAVVFVGGSSARDFDTQYQTTGAALAAPSVSDMDCGEGFDRSSLSLLGLQQRLLESLKSSGTPLVVVYIEGRPLDKSWASENADALLTQFYPGQEGGRAVADILFGDYNPAGRLPVSVPRDSGQLPVYYSRPYPLPHDYIEENAAPLYSFGYGLSYTSFSYDSLQLTKTDSGQVIARVSLSNTGDRDGDEVVQLYVRDEIASSVRPALRLCAFDRIHLRAGESGSVEFLLGEDAFSLYDKDMHRTVEPGDFLILAGGSSDSLPLSSKITL